MLELGALVLSWKELMVIVCFVVLFTLLIIQLISYRHFKKRVCLFLQTGGSPQDIESMLLEYLRVVKSIDEKYLFITDSIQDINRRLSTCVQKVGIIRYNPFPEMGGNLCFALALLDESGNGVVVNTIHDRNSSYTYAKPIVENTSTYNLSDEEKEAIKIADGWEKPVHANRFADHLNV
ncbi:MAG: DUF4446 family protein [Clostridiales bacterium]|nr:DUF4446 family protein [Clostridiales bacterium]